MFDLNVRSYDENALGEATRVRFRCGCMMRPAGVGLVLRSCCRDHVPNETGEKVVLGALEGGPWLVDLALRMRLMPAGIARDVAGDLALAGNPEWQAAQRAEQAAAEQRLMDETQRADAATMRVLKQAGLVPLVSSESPHRWYQFEALRRRIRAAAWRFFDNFQA